MREVIERLAVVQEQARRLMQDMDALARERREVGTQLEASFRAGTTEIKAEISQLRLNLKTIDDRLEALEDERDEIKRFKRRLLSYAAWLAGLVATTYQVMVTVIPWIKALVFGPSAPP